MLLGERRAPEILTAGNLLVLLFEELLVVFAIIRIAGVLFALTFLFPPLVDLISNACVIVLLLFMCMMMMMMMFEPCSND